MANLGYDHRPHRWGGDFDSMPTADKRICVGSVPPVVMRFVGGVATGEVYANDVDLHDSHIHPPVGTGTVELDEIHRRGLPTPLTDGIIRAYAAEIVDAVSTPPPAV